MPPRKKPTAASSAPALLVIEKQKYHRRALCRFLRAAGSNRVAEAVDLEAAQRVLAEHADVTWIAVTDPDLIPPDGLAALKRLTADHPGVSVLLLSPRRTLAELAEQARSLGLPLIAAMRKPVSAEEMSILLEGLAQTGRRPAPTANVLTKDELSECLRTGQLRARFQPKLDLLSGQPVSCEALPYVTHARYGDIPAERFTQAMVQLGAQRVMTATVLRDAADLVRSLRAAGLAVKVSINLGSDVLSEPGDATSLDAYVRTLGIAPSDLALEIGTHTDDALASPSFADNLARLKVRGYALAIDAAPAPAPLNLDDSTHAHFSELKLSWADYSKHQGDPEISKSVVATLTTARKYGMTTCAVGLETDVDLAQVRRAGFELGQGELFAPTLAAEETLTWVTREELDRSFAQPVAPKRQRSG